MTDNEHPYNALPKEHLLDNGKYELVRVLGRPGGFGITYLGFDHHLDEAVAIKEYLPSDLATRATDHSVVPQASHFRDDFQWGRNNFFNEALTLARFDHRHIIKVHRLFEAHNTAYIVMEYAEGETLEEYLEREGPLPEAELKGILYPLLDGLAVVHEAGILHRDIKPSNIMIREDGSPVLIDFGSARQAIGAKSRALSAIVTPGYAPIEQYSSGGNQGAWTDLYALGGVCYSALTGQVPDDATARVPNDPLVPVSRRCAGWGNGAFLSAIDGALSVYGEDRPQSIAVWQKMLEKEETANFWENVADALLEARKPPSSFFSEFVWQRQKQTFEKQRWEQAAARREQAAQERKAEVARALEKQRREEEQAILKGKDSPSEWILLLPVVAALLIVGLKLFAVVTAQWPSVVLKASLTFLFTFFAGAAGGKWILLLSVVAALLIVGLKLFAIVTMQWDTVVLTVSLTALFIAILGHTEQQND